MENYKILIIDDLGSVHDDFFKLLNPIKNPSSEKMHELKSLVFSNEASTPTSLPPFQLHTCFQGEEGIELIRKAVLIRQPYALAFVDVLMPPGIDGIDTILKIRELDPEIQIVICTAYARYSWEEIRHKLRGEDNFFILKKPFDRMEVIQLACTLTKKWNIENLKKNMIQNQNLSGRTDIDSTIADINQQMNTLKNILEKF